MKIDFKDRQIQNLIGLLIILSAVATVVLSFSEEKLSLKEAMYYKKIDEPKNAVFCQLCPRRCTIPEGKSGFCRARKNIKGTL